MKRDDTLRNLLFAASIVAVVWLVGERYFMPPIPPRSAGGTEEAVPAVVPGVAGPESVGAPANNAPPVSRVGVSEPSPANRSVWTIVGTQEDQVFTLGAADGERSVRGAPEPAFRMQVEATNRGAGISAVRLTDHAQSIRDASPYGLLGPVESTEFGMLSSLAIEKISIDDVSIPLHAARWVPGGSGGVEDVASLPLVAGGPSGQRIRFRLDLEKNGVPGVRLTRTIEVPRQTKVSGRHDVGTELAVENLDSEAHRVVLTYRGALGVTSSNGQRDDRVLDVGVFESDGRLSGKRTLWPGINRGAPQVLFAPQPLDPGRRLSWTASGNTYFTATVAPTGGDGVLPSESIAEVSVVDLDGSPLTQDDVVTRFTHRVEVLAAGQSRAYRADVFLGEKDAATFNSVPAYQKRNYYYQIEQGFSICTFNQLVELMIWLLNRIHDVLPNYGAAIIVLVLIVRLMLHPITKKGQINMVCMQQQMGALAPKIEEIKKKHGADKVRLQQETMRVYRESGINPGGQFLTCLPMLIQMPIWVALWLSLSNNIAMRHAPFAGWIQDLTAPDALFTFASPLHVPVIGWAIFSFNLLPFLVAATMYLQQKTQPKPKFNPNMSKQQREQQEMMMRMMPIMSIMMLFLFYSAPSGLTLYITASSLFGTLEQWRIRKLIARREADGTLYRPKKTALDVASGAGPIRKTRLPSWLQWIQQKAEDAQKAQRTQPRGRSRRVDD